jgi:hypothetical protein
MVCVSAFLARPDQPSDLSRTNLMAMINYVLLDNMCEIRVLTFGKSAASMVLM